MARSSGQQPRSIAAGPAGENVRPRPDGDAWPGSPSPINQAIGEFIWSIWATARSPAFNIRWRRPPSPLHRQHSYVSFGIPPPVFPRHSGFTGSAGSASAGSIHPGWSSMTRVRAKGQAVPGPEQRHLCRFKGSLAGVPSHGGNVAFQREVLALCCPPRTHRPLSLEIGNATRHFARTGDAAPAPRHLDSFHVAGPWAPTSLPVRCCRS